MQVFEKLGKIVLLSAFCFLNAVDLIQTVQGNPWSWLILKIALTFGLPLGLYRLDVYLKSIESRGFFTILRWFVILTYVSVFIADILYSLLVLRRMSLLVVSYPKSLR